MRPWTVRALAVALAVALAAGCTNPSGRALTQAATRPSPARTEPAVPAAPPPQVGHAEPAPVAPMLPEASDEIRAARAYAQRRVLRGDDALLPELRPASSTSPAELPGVFVPLDEPAGHDALAHFHERLDALARARRAQPDATEPKLRIAVYGASGTTADLWTGYVRAYLQRRFGDGGPGMVAAAPHNRWYRHNELQVTGSKAWKTEHPQRKVTREDGRYGLMMVLMRGAIAGLRSEIAPAGPRTRDLRVARYELFYEAFARGGSLQLSVDGVPRTRVHTRAREPQRGYAALDVEPGPHTLGLALSGDGEVRLYGVVAESDRAGIVLDNFGFDGAKETALLANDEVVWSEQLKRRGYDLSLLAYGTNTAFDDREQPLAAAAFEADFAAVLDRFGRAAQGASCVVMLPGLHDGAPAGEIAPAARVAAMRPIIRRLAHARGCAVWDAAAFEGGPGVLPAWLAAGMLGDDYVHYTRRGAVRMGTAVADALLQRWDLSAQRSAAQVAAAPTLAQ